MDIMEIILLIAGGAIFALSFLIPDKKGASVGISTEDIKPLVEQELAAAGARVEGTVGEAVAYAMEETERSMEKLSNEKIMAINEYSDTVLTEIHKNHEEAMFLYDMLNNKHSSLKNAVAEVNRTVKEAQEAMEALRKLAAESVVLEEAPGVEEHSGAEEMMPETQEGLVPGEVHGDSAVPQMTERFLEDEEQGRNNNERIMNLYRQGRSAKEIAKELELGVGEVKLVIDLFRSQPDAAL